MRICLLEKDLALGRSLQALLLNIAHEATCLRRKIGEGDIRTVCGVAFLVERH
ncbi:hypothetical protein [Paucibacter sp. KBW04]|uniref:hypothetical protein n=1 Tax=Paucibacter sp. KBW04 TaxID=2153361 RepID=UPI0012DCD6CF|nr:hypothetical protein [Paucibacter sp. KBW04]